LIAEFATDDTTGGPLPALFPSIAAVAVGIIVAVAIKTIITDLDLPRKD
jgi:hypothetical protein